MSEEIKDTNEAVENNAPEVEETVEAVEETVETKAEAENTAEENAEVTTLKPQRKQSRRRKIETVEPVESEWKEQVVQIRRVTKVVKGGKKLSFRAIVIVGNKKGQVGMGVAKASEVIVAIQKAIADGRKNLITVPIFKTTIPHMITGRSGAGNVVLKPASQGTGVIAGGAVRAVLELCGIENILSKSMGSKSTLNAKNATLNALTDLRTFKAVAAQRGISMKHLLGY